jgi:tetratricopeptide (TPR) repeat protein
MTTPLHATGAMPPGSTAPLDPILRTLSGRPAEAWLEAGRALVLKQDLDAAAAVLRAALAHFPDDAELRLALAGVCWQRREHGDAQVLLDELLARQPGHVAAVFTVARLHAERDALPAAEAAFRALFGRFAQPADLALRAAKMLADWGRKPAAAEICEAAIAAGADDAMLHLYAAALQGQLGEFERSRRHYLFALDHDPRTLEFGAAYGLASISRYDDPDHADLARFAALLQRPGLDARSRASLLFALGKIHDDLGRFEQAAAYFREANALVDRENWSRKNWRRVVDARLSARPLPARTPAAGECVPIFVVGAPRSGTTLVAELLGRSPRVRNRGELDWLPYYAERVARAGRPTPELLEEVASAYLAKLRQEESDVRWFVDKQPLNFLHVDLIRALFPQAAIVHCRRGSRDTALSIWTQHFGSTEYRFAYDFDDIAAVLQGCSRLMARAARDPGARVLEVRYEDLAREPQAVVDGLAAALCVPAFDCSEPEARRHAIGTASVWQARQPVYTRAIGRWRAYAPFVPELLKFADD